MKLSHLYVFIAIALAALNTSCEESKAGSEAPGGQPPENGAQFKKGEGVSLTDEMKKSIGLNVAEVTEQEVPSALTLEFTATGSQTAIAPVNSQQATLLKAGAEIHSAVGSAEGGWKGIVQSVDKVAFGGASDSEVTIALDHPVISGSTLKGTLQIPSSGMVTAIPASALLKTAEGTFVYAVNGNFYVRTPVKVGARNDSAIEITDGLYSGDQIVTTPVMSLWMAELQVLRGGKACTCGH